MRTYYGNFWFGVKDNRLYVTNRKDWAEEAGRTYGASLGVKPWAKEVKANRLYASVNPSGIQIPYLNMVDYATLALPDGRHAKMEIVLKDKQQNLLELLVKIFK